MSQHTPQFVEMAEASLAEARLPEDAGLPVVVRDALRDATDAVRDGLQVASGLEASLAELADRKLEMTKPHYDKVRAETIEAAKIRAQVAQRRYAEASEAAESAALDAALPKLATDREFLARQEFEVALGGASGAEVSSRVLGLARHGSPEVQSVLNTSFARTSLIARSAPNIDKVLRAAKQIVVENGATPEATRARVALDKLGKLGPAQGAAGAALRVALPRG
jgi:hypothetical protein